jgi:FKBP-type peptidyl-prolyl cis-trans isomerase
MRKIVLALLISTGLMTSMCTNTGKVSTSDLKTLQDTVSYLVGMNMGTQWKQQEVDFNPEIIYAALKSALNGDTSMFNQAQAQKIFGEFQNLMRERSMEKSQRESKENKAKGEEYLEKNKAKKGVKVTESGLQYEVLVEGKGAKPKATDKVKVHYHGTLIDGKVFDSSVDRGQPTEFGVSNVIKGWTEALQLMPVGSKWRLVIPSDIAYGDRRVSADIAPGSTLIFEVELLDIVTDKK